MTNPSVAQDQFDAVDKAADTPDGLSCCGHPDAEHDAVARRYCAATLRGSLERGCVCHSSTSASRFR